MLFKSFIISQFNYCSIIRTCHARGRNNKIKKLTRERIKDRSPRQKSSFRTLSKRGKSATIPMKNLQYLATEIFKEKNGLSSKMIKQICFSRK